MSLLIFQGGAVVTGNPANTIENAGEPPTRGRSGRHRIGQPGLQYWRELPGIGSETCGKNGGDTIRGHRRRETFRHGSHRVRPVLGKTRPPAVTTVSGELSIGPARGGRRGTTRPPVARPLRLAAQAGTALVSVTAAAALGIGAWFTATGAGAVALMVIR